MSLSPSPFPPAATDPPTIRIAILDTASTPLPLARAKYGNWATISGNHLLAGADTLGLPRDRLQISKWDVVNGYGEGLGGEYPALEDVDVLLITGSRSFLPPPTPFPPFTVSPLPLPPPPPLPPLANTSPIQGHSVYETTPWIVRLIEFIKHALLGLESAQPSVRVIGSCFGHQVVAAALGAQVARSPLGWEISVCEVDLTEVGKGLMEGKDRLVRLTHFITLKLYSLPLSPTHTPT